EITDGADRRASGGRPGVRQHEHVGTPGTPGSWIGEMANGGAAKDGFLGRGGRVVHPDGCVHLALEEVVVGRTGHDLEEAPGYDHPAVGVADVFVWLEERPAVLPEPFEEDLQGIATLGMWEDKVHTYP